MSTAGAAGEDADTIRIENQQPRLQCSLCKAFGSSKVSFAPKQAKRAASKRKCQACVSSYNPEQQGSFWKDQQPALPGHTAAQPGPAEGTAGGMRVCAACHQLAQACYPSGVSSVDKWNDHEHSSSTIVVQPQPGKHALRHWMVAHAAFTMPIVQQMLTQLPLIDTEAAGKLLQDLHQVTASGLMPSFMDDGARSGYIQSRFIKRASYAGTCLLVPGMEGMLKQLFDRETLAVAAIGGAAGSEVAGFLALREFVAAKTHLTLSVYDFEVGWQRAVSVLAGIFKLQVDSVETHFAQCDLLSSLDQPVNSPLAKTCAGVGLFFFSYVCIENAKGLQDGEYQLLRQLFSRVDIGTVFIFMDSSFKLWDEIQAVAEAIRAVSQIRPKSGRLFGNTMVLRMEES